MFLSLCDWILLGFHFVNGISYPSSTWDREVLNQGVKQRKQMSRFTVFRKTIQQNNKNKFVGFEIYFSSGPFFSSRFCWTNPFAQGANVFLSHSRDGLIAKLGDFNATWRVSCRDGNGWTPSCGSGVFVEVTTGHYLLHCCFKSFFFITWCKPSLQKTSKKQ